jgi:hypothetical protein
MSKLSTFIHQHAGATLALASVLEALLAATPLSPVEKAVLTDVLESAKSTAENVKAAAVAEGADVTATGTHPALTPLSPPVVGDPFASLRK